MKSQEIMLPNHFYAECAQMPRCTDNPVPTWVLMMIMPCYGTDPEMLFCLALYNQKLLVNYKPYFWLLGCRERKRSTLRKRQGRQWKMAHAPAPEDPAAVFQFKQRNGFHSFFLILRLFHRTKQRFSHKGTIRTCSKFKSPMTDTALVSEAVIPASGREGPAVVFLCLNFVWSSLPLQGLGRSTFLPRERLSNPGKVRIRELSVKAGRRQISNEGVILSKNRDCLL